MTDRIKDGGPAFPRPNTDNVLGQAGMSLRDWFAGQALAGMIRNNPNTDNMWVAEQCYRYADAMLEARK